MSRFLAVTIVLSVSLGLGAPALAHDYEMKDLEALEKQEAWQEAVQHLGDILPSKRNDGWQRIAERSAAGYLLGLPPGTLIAAANDLVKRYPTLKKSKAFMQARADLGLVAFKMTYSNSRHSAGDDPWMQELKIFVESDPLTADLPLRAGKLVTSQLVAYLGMPFFKKAIVNDAAACKDAAVKATLVSALADNVWADDATALIGKTCFADVRGALEAALAKEGESSIKKNACPILAAKKVTNAACK